MKPSDAKAAHVVIDGDYWQLESVAEYLLIEDRERRLAGVEWVNRKACLHFICTQPGAKVPKRVQKQLTMFTGAKSSPIHG